MLGKLLCVYALLLSGTRALAQVGCSTQPAYGLLQRSARHQCCNDLHNISRRVQN